jgi:lysophospholipase L1-like esterase
MKIYSTAILMANLAAAQAVRYLGRVNPATKELTWPGTGVAFTFTGTSATISLDEVNGSNSVDLVIDGGEPTVISNVTSSSITTPSGLAQGNHTVELRKRSEALYGTIVLGDIATNGTLIQNVSPPPRKIEIIGDSISVGYGLDGTYPCTNTAALEDNPETYGALAAESLGADYSVIAWSGIGLVRNYVTASPDTSPVMPELYTRYGSDDADDSYTFPADWIPDAVVINLGTNDFGYVLTNASGEPYDAREPLDPSVYTAGVVSFVDAIQQHYADAEFFLMTSPMLSDSYPTTEDAQHTTQYNALEAAISQIGGNAHLVDWPTQGSAVGCDYHPNAATHAAEGEVLALAISSVLGW